MAQSVGHSGSEGAGLSCFFTSSYLKEQEKEMCCECGCEWDMHSCDGRMLQQNDQHEQAGCLGRMGAGRRLPG